MVPIDPDEDYDVLGPTDVEGYRARDIFSSPEDYRVPGEGSPRHSGDEGSSFLRRSHVGDASFAETSAAGAAASAAMSQVPTGMGVSHTIPRLPLQTATSDSSGSRSSNSNASGFGVLIDRPNQGLGYLPTMPEDSQSSGTVLSGADMHHLDEENIIPDDPDLYQDGEYTGAYAYASDPLLVPPKLFNPGSAVSRDFPSDLSEAEVLTAQRRTLVTSQTTPELPQLPDLGNDPAPTGLLGALGLSGLANLGRRSWFRNLESHRSSPDFTIEHLTDQDIETGRATLGPNRTADSRGRRVGASPDGSRPKSTSSARSGTSGGTFYHDAHSSVPGTPLLPPLPRIPVPAAPVGDQAVAEVLSQTSPPSGLPAHDDEDTTSSPGLTDDLNLRLNFVPGSDILDMPAPAALHHFVSISSLKDTTTGSSLALKTPAFPPGLDTVKPVGWSDVAMEVTDSSPSGSTFGAAFLDTSLSSSGRAMTDLLEDAPPDAEHGWRSIAGDAGRRGTFGLVRFLLFVFFFKRIRAQYLFFLAHRPNWFYV